MTKEQLEKDLAELLAKYQIQSAILFYPEIGDKKILSVDVDCRKSIVLTAFTNVLKHLDPKTW